MTATRDFFNNLGETLMGKLPDRTPESSSVQEESILARLGAGMTNMRVENTAAMYGAMADNAAAYVRAKTVDCILHGRAIGDHRDCIANTCRACRNPVTNQQIEEADAHMIDERGPDDGQFEHVECAQAAKYE